MLGEFVGCSLDFEDGPEYEHALMAMVGRFRNASAGVEVEDVELALQAERDGDTQLLNGVLSRQIRSRDLD